MIIFGNLWRGSLFEYHYDVARLGKPVDRKQWRMEPQTVNAVNLPLQNALNFPAAILQPPVLRSQGARRPQLRRHRHRHRPRDQPHLRHRRRRLRLQGPRAQLVDPGRSRPLRSRHREPRRAVRHLQTLPRPLHQRQPDLGENIADVAGIAAAYDAYHASLKARLPRARRLHRRSAVLHRLRSELGIETREAALRQQVLTDPHAPGQYRAATVRNDDAWYAPSTFNPATNSTSPPTASASGRRGSVLWR